MSDTSGASASPGTGTATASSSSSTNASSSNTQSSSSQTQGQAQLNQSSSQAGKADSTVGKDQVSSFTDQPGSGADDFEEVRLGSAKMRLSKADAQVIKSLQQGFTQKSQRLSELEKVAQLAKSDYRKFLESEQKDPYEFAESILAEKFELMQLTPEQKDQRERNMRLEKFEAQENLAKDSLIDELRNYSENIPEGLKGKTREEVQQIVERHRESYQKNWKALDSELSLACQEIGFPKDRQLLAKLSFEMLSSSKRGKPLTAQQAASKVVNEFTSSVRGTIGQMEISKMVDFLGPEVVEKIRQFDIKRVTDLSASQFGQNPNSHGLNPSSSNQTEKKQVNQSEWRKAMGIG